MILLLVLIIFAPKHQVKHFSDFRLKFDGTVLSDVSSVKNLGMYFDKTISIPWRLQISPTGFAKIQYSFGPKTEPCGTPKRSLISSDCTDPIAT
jgi:hypothetical protein